MTGLKTSILGRALVLAIFVATGSPGFAADTAPASATPANSPLWSAWGGTVGMRWNRDLATDIGLTIATPTARLDGLSWREHEQFNLRESGSLEFRVANGNLQTFVGGSVQARGGYVVGVRDGSIDLTDFRLRPRPDDALILDLVGADGKAWFYIDRVMYELADDNRVLAVRAMDVRISGDLAARIGHPEVADWAIADMQMSTEVQRQGSGAVPTGGGSYNWAGTPAIRPAGEPQPPAGAINQADLFMQTFTGQYSRCTGCTGTSSTSQLVFTPSSTLKNNVNNGTKVATIPGDPLGASDVLWTADIPWYQKFTGIFPPYGNDQHPYLIWNLYRLNADGSIDQVGRSGVKHAFLTTNQGCASGHGTNLHVLGRQCSDTYGTGNNDSSSDLGPRSEIIPASNQWGRCGSIFDSNCDGVAGSSGNTLYSQRMIVAESQIAPSTQPGATYLFESWYLAREDANIYNSMATKVVTPSWSGSVWSLGSGTNYRLGPAIDRWVNPTSPGVNERSVELASTEGHTKIAVKATDLGNGSWRYDYAVMNLDFARAFTEGAEPNLRVIHNLGFDRFRIVTAAGTAISNVTFNDGDLDPANNWTSANSASAVYWTAPVNPAPPANTPAVLNALNWGTMFHFSFVADAAPVAAGVHLHIAHAGGPDDPETLSATLIGPGSDIVFADGFETIKP